MGSKSTVSEKNKNKTEKLCNCYMQKILLPKGSLLTVCIVVVDVVRGLVRVCLAMALVVQEVRTTNVDHRTCSLRLLCEVLNVTSCMNTLDFISVYIRTIHLYIRTVSVHGFDMLDSSVFHFQSFQVQNVSHPFCIAQYIGYIDIFTHGTV